LTAEDIAPYHLHPDQDPFVWESLDSAPEGGNNTNDDGNSGGSSNGGDTIHTCCDGSSGFDGTAPPPRERAPVATVARTSHPPQHPAATPPPKKRQDMRASPKTHSPPAQHHHASPHTQPARLQNLAGVSGRLPPSPAAGAPTPVDDHRPAYGRGRGRGLNLPRVGTAHWLRGVLRRAAEFTLLVRKTQRLWAAEQRRRRQRRQQRDRRCRAVKMAAIDQAGIPAAVPVVMACNQQRQKQRRRLRQTQQPPSAHREAAGEANHTVEVLQGRSTGSQHRQNDNDASDKKRHDNEHKHNRETTRVGQENPGGGTP
jgi:hypothetical protein